MRRRAYKPSEATPPSVLRGTSESISRRLMAHAVNSRSMPMAIDRSLRPTRTPTRPRVTHSAASACPSSCASVNNGTPKKAATNTARLVGTMSISPDPPSTLSTTGPFALTSDSEGSAAQHSGKHSLRDMATAFVAMRVSRPGPAAVPLRTNCRRDQGDQPRACCCLAMRARRLVLDRCRPSVNPSVDVRTEVRHNDDGFAAASPCICAGFSPLPCLTTPTLRIPRGWSSRGRRKN